MEILLQSSCNQCYWSLVAAKHRAAIHQNLSSAHQADKLDWGNVGPSHLGLLGGLQNMTRNTCFGNVVERAGTMTCIC